MMLRNFSVVFWRVTEHNLSSERKDVKEASMLKDKKPEKMSEIFLSRRTFLFVPKNKDKLANRK